MSGEAILPDYFYYRAPLPQKVNLLNLKTNKENKFYWMLSLKNNNQNEENTSRYTTLAPYGDNDSEMLDCCELEDNYEINPTKSGKYITTFYVPTVLHSVIIGPHGSKLKELQGNTNTLIKVPKYNEEPLIKITGQSERSVASARIHITLLLLSYREKMKITHFVSIPLCSDEIRTNFLTFKQDILNGPPYRGIDETIFQKVEKLHLTLVTLTLVDDIEIEEAKNLLSLMQSDLSKIFKNKKPIIVLQGLEIMNDDPTEVDVLYAKVKLNLEDTINSLQEAAEYILDSFSRKGFIRKQYDLIKLHATLMNSIFLKNAIQRNKSDSNTKRASFDASHILDKHKNYYFGKTVLDKILLSVRFTTDVNGYYQSSACIEV